MQSRILKDVDKSFIKHIVEEGGMNPNGVTGQLQIACAHGNADYVGDLLNSLQIQDMTKAGPKLIELYRQMELSSEDYLSRKLN